MQKETIALAVATPVLGAAAVFALPTRHRGGGLTVLAWTPAYVYSSWQATGKDDSRTATRRRQLTPSAASIRRADAVRVLASSQGEEPSSTASMAVVVGSGPFGILLGRESTANGVLSCRLLPGSFFDSRQHFVGPKATERCRGGWGGLGASLVPSICSRSTATVNTAPCWLAPFAPTAFLTTNAAQHHQRRAACPLE